MEQDEKQRMVQEWGLEKMSPAEQNSFIDRIGQTLYHAVAMRATEEMSEEDQNTFEAFLAKEGDEVDMLTVLEYLKTHVAAFDQLVAEETAKLKEELSAL